MFILSVQATSVDGGILTYQWYKNTVPTNTGGTPLPGATNSSYQAPTDELGTFHYYVVVTNTISDNGDGGIKVASVASNVATLLVKYETQHEHSFGSSWLFDETGHWNVCVCGEVGNFGLHTPTDWIIDVQPGETSEGRKHIECSVCTFLMESEIIPPGGIIPIVVSVIPDTVYAPISGEIVITFNTAMDTSYGSVNLVDALSGESFSDLVSGSWSAGNTIFVIPYSDLEYETYYKVNITGFRSSIGHTLSGTNVFNFRTAGEGEADSDIQMLDINISTVSV